MTRITSKTIGFGLVLPGRGNYESLKPHASITVEFNGDEDAKEREEHMKAYRKQVKAEVIKEYWDSVQAAEELRGKYGKLWSYARVIVKKHTLTRSLTTTGTTVRTVEPKHDGYGID